ncbi:MAG TPA: AAA family ATPase [Rhodocyclaceae bacterium]|nr:AAA family ATPase [Rhodocyclaceae bacterium]
MRLKLKDTIARLGIAQCDLARVLNVSPGTIAQLCNHGIWPRNDSMCRAMRAGITQRLTEAGASADQLASVFEEWPLARGNATEADAHEPESHEDEHMLLRNESLTHEAREHFGLDRSPFVDDIRALDDVFASARTRRARAALLDCALNQGFVALVGESGSGKSTLREELEERIRIEQRPVVVIKPFTMEMERTARQGKPMWAGQISEAIIHQLAPGTSIRSSTQARNNQVRDLLAASQQAGYNNLLIVEEAHRMPVSTIRALKGFMELKIGLRRLLGVVLIGQPELDNTLSDKLADVREIVQRCERREMMPLDDDLPGYLEHKLARAGARLADVFADDAIDAIRARLVRIPRGGSMAEARSICYPLVVNNLVTRAMNAAAATAFPKVNAQVIKGC